MRRDNNPVGRLWESTMAAAFIAHPYGYPIIGWEADIRNLKAGQAERFFETHYRPERAVGVLVGDLDVERTRDLLRRTFGRIAVGNALDETRHILPEPRQLGERRTQVRLPASPTLIMAWHKPAAPDPADLRAEALMEVLTGGRSSRWFERFVKQERLAAEIGAFSGPGDAQPNLFMVFAYPQGETTLARLEQEVRDQVALLRAEPVDATELESAKKRLRADTIRTLETNKGLALALAETAQLSGDPYYLERRLRELEQLTPADLMDFARTWLTDDNLTVGTLQPVAADAQPAP
jgi:predicted Zn-dependent peptidase